MVRNRVSERAILADRASCFCSSCSSDADCVTSPGTSSISKCAAAASSESSPLRISRIDFQS